MLSTSRWIHEFVGYIARLIALSVLFQEIGEEEHLQDGKDDKQLNQDDSPKRLAQAHGAKSIVVEIESLM